MADQWRSLVADPCWAKNYAQIEKEMLTVRYGLEKFHHLTYGRHVTVVTDHKPLDSMKKKPLSKAPRRMQNMLLNTQKYNYSLVFKPGSAIPAADAMSRAPLPETHEGEDAAVHAVYAAPFRRERLDDIRKATEKDQAVQELTKTIVAGWPSEKTVFRIVQSHSTTIETNYQCTTEWLKGEKG